MTWLRLAIEALPLWIALGLIAWLWWNTHQLRRRARFRRYLEAKRSAAAELYAEGRISQAECFRHEVDVCVEHDSGPIHLIPIPSETT